MIGEPGDRIATLVQDNLVEIPDFPRRAFYSATLPAHSLRTDPRSSEPVELDRRELRGPHRRGSWPGMRGFILGAPVPPSWAWAMLTIRKAGKLPGEVIGVDYCSSTAAPAWWSQSVRDQRSSLMTLGDGGSRPLNQCGACRGPLSLMELDGLNGRQPGGVTVGNRTARLSDQLRSGSRRHDPTPLVHAIIGS